MRTVLTLLAIALPVFGTLMLTHRGGALPDAALAHAPPAMAAGASGGCWHVVGPDETLRSIARHYYGSGRLWRTLQVANDVGQRPAAGSRLWVPVSLPEIP